MNALMQIPGHIDPVTTPRDAPVRPDGRIDLVGLPKAAIAAQLTDAGLEGKQAKLRAKQLWHGSISRR
jgi:23S rRNA (adenine2503-C2)-methyltransferase